MTRADELDAELEYLLLTRWQRLRLRLTGIVKVGLRSRPGWTGSLMHYLVRCVKHGLYVTYPSGYHDRLICPLCWEEMTCC